MRHTAIICPFLTKFKNKKKKFRSEMKCLTAGKTAARRRLSRKSPPAP